MPPQAAGCPWPDPLFSASGQIRGQDHAEPGWWLVGRTTGAGEGGDHELVLLTGLAMFILIFVILTWFTTLLGINLYAFRYTGDECAFAGVNAAEIRQGGSAALARAAEPCGS